jgi:excisionase family DNA binding protein
MARTNKTSGATSVADRPTPKRRNTPDDADGVALLLVEPLLDCPAAAALLNVRVSWVRDAARQGQLPCVRVGRHLRFTRVMLEEWLVEQFERPPRKRRQVTSTSRGVAASWPRGTLRASTQAALLASLAETPTARKAVDDE